MTDITCNMSQYGTTKLEHSYFPHLPPSAPKASLSYCLAVADAPFQALAGVIVDGRQPSRHPVTPRCRLRKQVGDTNRWRMPQSLGSDLLGTSQAVKAVSTRYNSSMRAIITAESPVSNVNRDMTEPYRFRVKEDRPGSQVPPGTQRPHTSPAPATLGKSTPPSKYTSVGPVAKFVPPSARPTKPMDMFAYHAKRNRTGHGTADLYLECLAFRWELHRPYLLKSLTLAQLMRSQETEDEKHGQPITVSLDTRDPLITANALAVALGHTYHDDIEVDLSDVVGVMAAADCLAFQHLLEGCSQLMLRSITSHTVCDYHYAACKYKQEHVESACERWLEMNLIPKLSSQIQLRQLPMELLLKIISSNRLFIYNEFSVYRVLSYWLFMQLNPRLQLMPSYSTIMAYFNSLPKSSCLLEREEGEQFLPLFMSLRLHGVTDTNHLHDIQTMSIVPQTWIVKVLAHHYHALQAGGDFTLANSYPGGAVRQGFVIEDEPHFHSEIFSLHGFHFDLRATRLSDENGAYSFFMQRLKPSDPVLSFRQCERQTFSLRPDRNVTYSVRVQYQSREQKGRGQRGTESALTHVTSPKTQRFGLGTGTSKSEVITLDGLHTPIYVTFSLHFPPS